jgi:adenine-specific DNA-methyltransferase
MLDLSALNDGVYLFSDCQILMPEIPNHSIAAVITDPPYGMGKGDWDYWNEDLAKWLVDQSLRVLKPNGSVFLFGHKENIAQMWNVFKPLNPRWLTWFYRNSSNINHPTFGWNSQVIVYGHLGEPIFHLDEARIPYSKNTNTKRVNHDDTASNYGIKKNGKNKKRYNPLGRKPMDVIEWPSVTAGVAQAEGRWHTTQKPLGLMEKLVKVCTNQGDIVLDPFAGGATTLLAARNCGRKYIGFEKKQAHWQAGMKRLEKPE